MWFEIFPAIAKRVVTSTDLDPEVVIGRIRGLLIGNRQDVSAEPLGHRGGFHYGGEFKNGNFTVYPRLPIRHGGYRLVVRGRVDAVSGGSRLVICMRSRLWLVMLVPLAIMEWSIIKSRDDSLWWVPAFWLLYHSLGSLLVWWQARK